MKFFSTTVRLFPRRTDDRGAATASTSPAQVDADAWPNAAEALPLAQPSQRPRESTGGNVARRHLLSSLRERQAEATVDSPHSNPIEVAGLARLPLLRPSA